MLKKLLQLLKKDERGLTLVELLAVIVILAIVGAIAFVSIGNVMENSKEDAHISNALQAISAAELAKASGEKIEANTPATSLTTFDDNIVNPFTKETTYNLTVSPDGDDFTVSSTEGECKLTDKTKAELNSEGRNACETTGD